MSSPSVCVLNTAGINCNEETAFAFELAGAETEQRHISELSDHDLQLSDYQILALPGGFSYGDAIASGRILGLELKTRLRDQVDDFVSIGGLVIGICNGFQVLVESGLLPDPVSRPEGPKAASLIPNKTGDFQCRWSDLRVEASACAFANPITMGGDYVELPSAHGEGQFLQPTPDEYKKLADQGQIVFRYCGEDGEPTAGFPDNPNGSPGGITGICDPSGNILGMMPHPERFVVPQQHPNYHRYKALGQTIVPHGLPLFEAMVDYAQDS
ncbi:MAG TPA: phosphoribosylformylglycinamidine synthase I [Verrucomicrobiae bacterium]|nr:phosphoribosylformylglycinamidine synthase I [Verrucomicrobiae bacterium]